MATCHSHLDLQDIQEGSSIRSFSLSPTPREARLHEASRVEHNGVRSRIGLSDDKSSQLSTLDRAVTDTLARRHSRAVEFEPVTHIIVLSDAEKGRPRVQLRRLSVSLSFSKGPSEESLDDPSFTPTSPRRICVRVPSLTRSHARSNSVDRQSNNQCLRSCLVSNSDSPRSNVTGLNQQNIEHKKSFLSPKSSPVSPREPASSLSVGMSSSAPAHEGSMLSGFMSRPRPNRSPSTNSSLPARHSNHLEDPTEVLQVCCLTCHRGTELGLQGEWEDAPWSPGAIKKKRKDDEEREKKEAERRRLGERYGKLPPLSPGGCIDEVDWEDNDTFNRFGTNVVVDEVTLARRNSSDHHSGTGSPVGLNHSVTLLRLARSSPSSSPQENEPPLISPRELQADLPAPSMSPPWMPKMQKSLVDEFTTYDGMPSSETTGSFFPDFQSSSIFGRAIVEAPSPIETPELTPASVPRVGHDSGSVSTTHSDPISSLTDNHFNQFSTSPSAASPSSPLIQPPSSVGPSSPSSPVVHPVLTTTAPPLTKRFLSGLSFGGINKVFKHSTKEAGAGHGFF